MAQWCGQRDMTSTTRNKEGPSGWLNRDQRKLQSDECASNPAGHQEVTLLPRASKWLWPSPQSEEEVTKATQDNNCDIRSWKIELKDRSKHCTCPVTYTCSTWPMHAASDLCMRCDLCTGCPLRGWKYRLVSVMHTCPGFVTRGVTISALHSICSFSETFWNLQKCFAVKVRKVRSLSTL